MVCPACGHEQPEGFECQRCGIVFAKWEEHRRRTSRITQAHGWHRRLGRTAMFGRMAAALISLFLAVLMYLNGVALRSFGPFVALVFFLGAALYLLFSLRERVTMGRLVGEMGTLAVASLALSVALPEVFSPRRTLFPEAIHEPLPEAARGFLEQAKAYHETAVRFLSTEEISEPVQVQGLLEALDPSRTLDSAFRTLPETDQGLVRGVWMRMRSLHPFFQQVGLRIPAEVPAGPARFLPGPLVREVASQLDRIAEELALVEAEVSRREQAVRASGSGKGAQEP